MLEDSQRGVPIDSATSLTSSKWEQLRALLALAIPVVLAEIGWMSMGIVDTLMVGPLGPQAIGATGLGSGVFSAVSFFGMGLLLGLDTLVSQAFGGRRVDECHRLLFHGLTLAVLLALPLTIVIWLISRALDGRRPAPGYRPARVLVPVAGECQPAAAADLRGVPALSAGDRIRRTRDIRAGVRESRERVRQLDPDLRALRSARDGDRRLGARHRGRAHLHGRRRDRRRDLVRLPSWRHAVARQPPHRNRAGCAGCSRSAAPPRRSCCSRSVCSPSATLLAGKLTPVASAAHQIALNIISLTFMVPLGVASAGAVMVGRAIGRHDPNGARRAGWMALGIGAAFMAIVGILLVIMPRLADRPLHDRRRDDRPRRDAADRRLRVSVVRWAAGRGHRRAPRHRRHAHADDLQPDRPLGDRPAGRRDVVLHRRVGRRRPLARPVASASRSSGIVLVWVWARRSATLSQSLDDRARGGA